MKTFAYRGLDGAGRAARGMIEAIDAKDARERLAARGVLAEDLSAATGATNRVARRPMNPARRAMLYRELASLLAAGLPLTHALEILLNAPEPGSDEVALAAIRDRIREGSTLDDAMALALPGLTPMERAVLKAGERSGLLDTVLVQLADYLEYQVAWREQLQTAFLYPAVVLVVALFVGLLMMVFLLPNMAKVFAESEVQLPWITRVMMAAGKAFVPVGLPLLGVAGVGLWSAYRAIQSSAQRKEAWERRLHRVPMLGPTRVLTATARFARTWALLMKGGVPVADAMELAGDATGSLWIARVAREEAQEVRHGRPISRAVAGVAGLHPSLTGWVGAGEAAGRLVELLHEAAQTYDRQAQRFARRFNALIEPVLIVGVGLFVLLVALAVILPLMSLNRSLG